MQAAARPDRVNLLAHVVATAQQSQAAQHDQVLGTQSARGEYAQALRGEHHHQGAVFELTDHARPHTALVEPVLQRRAQHRVTGRQQDGQVREAGRELLGAGATHERARAVPVHR